MASATNLRAVGDRVAALVDELGALGAGPLRAKAEELVRALMQLYGGGIERLLEIVWEERDSTTGGEVVDRQFARLADDGLVSALLLLHGLHPLDTATRVERALVKVRPALAAHGGDVTLLGIEDEVVRLRLDGNCHGCPSSTVTMKLAVEAAIADAAPEVRRIDVDGAVALPGREAPGDCRAGEAVVGDALVADAGLVQLGGHPSTNGGAPLRG